MALSAASCGCYASYAPMNDPRAGQAHDHLDLLIDSPAVGSSLHVDCPAIIAPPVVAWVEWSHLLSALAAVVHGRQRARRL